MFCQDPREASTVDFVAEVLGNSAAMWRLYTWGLIAAVSEVCPNVCAWPTVHRRHFMLRRMTMTQASRRRL
jgi:hypothetical protein